MQQLALFERRELMRCPLCSYVHHCGSEAEKGIPEVGPGYINIPIWCLRCKAGGVISTNTEERCEAIAGS
jgi:hypothetical protein